jgi:hypothetical protein
MKVDRLPKICAALLASASLLIAGAAHAMEIEKFDKMAARDQSDYIVVLIEGAQQVLLKEGKKELAAKVHALFTTTLPGDQSPVGVVEFESNLARARSADVRRLLQDSRATRLKVEDAMIVTIEKNGIPLPDTFFTVASGFRPKYPPKR